MKKFEEWFYKTYKTDNMNSFASQDTFYGWIACKNEVLKILEKPLQNLDLSEENCDNRYIEKIKEEI